MRGMTAPRVLVLLNAASGDGIDQPTLDYLDAHASGRIRELDLVVVNETQAIDLVARARAELASGVRAVVVRGGDGMVNLGVNLVAGTGIPLGIIPAGTGNDFARSIGIPTGRGHQALDALLRAAEYPDAFTESVDALRVRTNARELLVANSVNFGFDSLVNEEANALRGRAAGPGRYLVAIARLLAAGKLDAHGAEFTIELDGQAPETRRAIIAAALNGKTFGGGIRVAPHADLADGALELLLVDAVPAWKLLVMLPTLLVGAHTRLPQVRIERARRMRVVGPPEMPVFADGDEVGRGGYVAEVVPGAWRLLRG